MANSSVEMIVSFFIVMMSVPLITGFSVRKDLQKIKKITPSSVPDLQIVISHKEGKSCPTCAPAASRRRTKRCTCLTYKDKECVYYCHLDIIWINTPEHIVTYGMSGYQSSSRQRRSARRVQDQMQVNSQRCVCATQTDSECSSFCRDRKQKRSSPTKLALHKVQPASHSTHILK